MKIEKIQNDKNFEQKAFDFISLFEGFEPKAYYDSKGIPHIGYGFNLTDKDVFDAVFDKIFLPKGKYESLRDPLWGKGGWKATKIKGSNQDLQNTIQGLIKNHLQEEKEFSLKEGEAQEIAKSLIPKYSQILENKMRNKNLGDVISNFRKSYEYIALLSLAYINPTKLIGPKLYSALKNGNRFKAWFEIRYNSNGGKDIGIAKRRFAESNVFGLFDGYKRNIPQTNQKNDFTQTIWKQDKSISLQEACNLFVNLHSEFDKEGKKSYFEYVKYYEREQVFGQTTIQNRYKKEKDEAKPDLKNHFLPYTEVFAPFAEVLKEKFSCKANIESKIHLVDRILVINSQEQLRTLKGVIEGLINEEIELRGENDEAIPQSPSPLLDIYIIIAQEGLEVKLPSLQANLWVYSPNQTQILIDSGNQNKENTPDNQEDRGDNIFLFVFEFVKNEENLSVKFLPIVGSSNQPLQYQSDGLIAQGNDEEGNSQNILYSFQKQGEGNYSPILKASCSFAEIQICHLCFKDYKITQEKQKACNISFFLPPLQTHSTDSSNQELHQAIKKTYEKSQAQFYVYLYNSNTFEPLEGVRVGYGGKEAISSDEGIASFSFEIESIWDTHRIYPISILSSEYSSFSTYACSLASSAFKSKAYKIGLLKKAEMSYKDKTLMFDFCSYKVKEIVFPSKDLKSFRLGAISHQELEKDFFKSCSIHKSKISRNAIKITKNGMESVAYITYKKEKLTYMDMGFILEERDYRHLRDAIQKEDVDIYEFKDEGEYFYLKDISISSSFEGRSASSGVNDTLKLKANFSKNLDESKKTKWGYITFTKGVEVRKELYALRRANTISIERVEGFEALRNENGEEIEGEEVSIPCLFEWRDRQVLLFGYTSTPSLNNSILLLPTSTQEEEEEVLITSLENSSEEEYLKFIFPTNPTQNSQSLMQCDEFMIEDMLCSLQALSLEEEEEARDDRAKSMDKESIKKHLKRFSKEASKKGRREVEFEKELDDLFVHTSRNAKSTSSKINQNKSKVEEALLDDGTKVIRSRAYREFNKVEQKFLDSAVLVQVEGKSIAQRTQVLDLGAVSVANMKSGKAPLGKDGKIIELHHLQQKEDGILIELTYTEHKENSKALHSYKTKSEIDRVKFANFKKKYWKARAEGLGN